MSDEFTTLILNLPDLRDFAREYGESVLEELGLSGGVVTQTCSGYARNK